MKKAFNLAEVLITLTVIGVVAAIVIPVFISNNNKKIYATAVHQFYSDFQNGIKLYVSSEGVSDFSQTPLYNEFEGGDAGGYDTTVNAFKSIYKNYQMCSDDKPSECLPEYKNLTGNKYLFGRDYSSSPKIITANGAIVGISKLPSVWSPCSNWRNNRCADVFVDINGKKGPNISGRDFFAFGITAAGNLIPGSYFSGEPSDGNNCFVNSGGHQVSLGDDCSETLINNNWEMKY